MFPLDKDPRMELSRDHVIVLFFIVTAPIYFSTNTAQEFSLLEMLASNCYLLSNNSHFNRCDIHPHFSAAIIRVKIYI